VEAWLVEESGQIQAVRRPGVGGVVEYEAGLATGRVVQRVAETPGWPSLEVSRASGVLTPAATAASADFTVQKISATLLVGGPTIYEHALAFGGPGSAAAQFTAPGLSLGLYSDTVSWLGGDSNRIDHT
jgi:hypothetical protein